MALRTDSFDLTGLRLSAGEARRLELHVAIGRFDLANERYEVVDEVPVRLDISRTSKDGYALRLRFQARLSGPCMRCLSPATPSFEVDAREVSQPGEGEELESPYVQQGSLDLSGWAHDALALAVPSQLVCRADCAGLCPLCGADLNTAGQEHHHEREPDPRWARLSELKFDS
jgi:uncharacterized protein